MLYKDIQIENTVYVLLSNNRGSILKKNQDNTCSKYSNDSIKDYKDVHDFGGK